MKRKIFAFALAFALALSLLPVQALEYGGDIGPEKTYTQTFRDVPTDNWAFIYIEDLVARGAINGYPDGNYYPEKIVTREEFAKIMLVAAGLAPTPVQYASYTDVPADYWASPYIEAAKDYMTAYQNFDGTTAFKPKDGALREDIAVAVVRLKGYDTRLADLSIIQTMFSDVDGISAAAQPYVALAVENGIISGYTDGTFRGQNTITRSEAAAMLWRAFQKGNDNKVTPDAAPSATPKPAATPKPSAAPKPSATPKPSASPKPTAAPEPEKPFIAETLVKNVKISDTYLMMTMDDDSNLIFYNAKSDTIVSLDPDTDQTTTLLDVSRATIEVPVEAETAGLSALDEEEGTEPPAAEADEPPAAESDEPPADETEPEPIQAPEPETPTTVTYEDLTVKQVFWDDVAHRLLVWGEFTSVKEADDGWSVPNKRQNLHAYFSLDNGELAYFADVPQYYSIDGSGIGSYYYPSAIDCALDNGTFVLDGKIFDFLINQVIAEGLRGSAVFQNSGNIYICNSFDGKLCKYNFGTTEVEKICDIEDYRGAWCAYANGVIYQWTKDGISAIRPSDGATRTKLNPAKDVAIKDLRPLPAKPNNLRVTSDEQYLFYDSSSNAIRVIRPNPAA